MKTKILTFFLAALFINCKKHTNKTNYFTSQNDTLIIETEKFHGSDMFSFGASPINFVEVDSFKHYSINTPKNISEIKIGYKIIDWKIYSYLRYKKGEISNEFLIKDVQNNKLDTTITHNIKKNSISILSGKKDNQKIFIVDENNNKDFKDDTIRNYREINWSPKENDLIKCSYNIYNEKELVEDKTWLNIGTSNNNFLFGVAQNLQAKILINNNEYEIGITTKSSSFCFDEPIAALISENGIKKDSLMKSEILVLGEYFNLNNEYYKFESITNDGRKIKLIKEKDVSDKVGTQVGFIASNFECTSIKNDTISLKDYKDDFLLLTNITSCYSPISSYECYKELYNEYNSKIKILAIDNSPNFLNFQINRLDLKGDFIISDENLSIKENYRQDFCSRTCFLINPKGSVIDKFEIFDWKQTLSKYFK